MTTNRSRGSIDWPAIRERMARLDRASSASVELSEEAAGEVLAARARSLAANSESEPEAPLHLLLFELAGETYGVETRFVFEAVRSLNVALLPGAEPPVAGIGVWRGRLLTLLDLRPVLGLPVTSDHAPQQALVLGERAPVLGILVDSILDLLETPSAAVQSLSSRAGSGKGLLESVTPEAVQVIAARDLLEIYG